MKKVGTNKSHKKADLSDVMLKFKKGAFVIAAGLNMAVFLGGAAMNPQASSITEESNIKDDSELAHLPENPGIDKKDLLHGINHEREKKGLSALEDEKQITNGDLKNNLRFLDIKCSEGSDLSWLKLCSNIEGISIHINDPQGILNRSYFSNLPKMPKMYITINECNSNTDLKWLEDYRENIYNLGIYITDNGEGWINNQKYISKLQNLEKLYIDDYASIPMNEANFGSIKKISSLQEFKFTRPNETKKGYGDIDPQFFYDISNMPNMKRLGLPIQLYSLIDYTKFGTDNKNLHELYMSGKIGPGDIAMSLTPEELDYLKNNGITFLHDGDLLRVKEINDKLSKIIKEINFREDMTDEEKRNKIVVYLCRNLQYDEEVSELSKELVEDFYSNSEIKERYNQKFYKDGYLYGALESDTQLCGNYAGLFNAIAERVGLESYIISSMYHAYNLVNINGKYILVDPTWIDGQDGVMHYIPELDEYEEISVVDEIDKYPEAANKEVKWLNVDSTKFYAKDNEDSHYSINIPENVQQAIEDVKNSENDEKNKAILMSEKTVNAIAITIFYFLLYENLEEKRRNQEKQKQIEQGQTNNDDGAMEK